MPWDGDVFRDPRWHLTTACFHHPHLNAGIFAEPRGDGGAGRTRAHDDVILMEQPRW